MFPSCTAILLAAGKGSRMGGPVPKQYLPLHGRPLAAWSLRALAASSCITDIVMVIPEGDEDYVRNTVIPAAGEEARGKVRALVPGGAERYLSVWNGLRAITWDCAYVAIHDGARPLIDEASIQRLYDAVRDPANGGTAVAGMPSKDTVKITNAGAFVENTPDRSRVWIVQTPQVFERELITTAYEKMAESLPALTAAGVNITDDAMLVETLCHRRVRLIEASYRNIKVTTPEDIPFAESILQAEQ